jgi:hypothetical protein
LCALLPLYLCNVRIRYFINTSTWIINTHVCALTVTCRSNPGVIVRLCPLAWQHGLAGAS